MNAFISWSGGKDCMFALYAFSKNTQNQVCCLVNFSTADGAKSNSHGLSKELILAQSDALGIPVIQQPISTGNYEFHLKEIITGLKLQGVNAGVFGDIHLQEHRIWIERVCHDMDIVPVFPLWGKDTSVLLKEFIQLGFRTILVSVRNEEHLAPLVGRELDNTLRHKLSVMNDIDPCGENGEYHSFVFDGPLFKQPLLLTKGTPYVDDCHLYLPVHL